MTYELLFLPQSLLKTIRLSHQPELMTTNFPIETLSCLLACSQVCMKDICVTDGRCWKPKREREIELFQKVSLDKTDLWTLYCI